MPLPRPIAAPLTTLGHGAIYVLELIGGLGYLVRDTAAALPRSLLSGRGRRLGWRNLWAQMVRVGVRSIPIVTVVLLAIGAILVLQIAPILRDYGALNRVADIISIAVFRELGPLVSAIVLTGFAGASIAAEVGTMVVSEEIEALEAQAIPPIRFLVVPRVLATAVMTVCVSVGGNLAGVFGGLAVAYFNLEISSQQYLHHTFDAVELDDFYTGLIKAGVFGVLISGIACHLGLSVTGGAQGVGAATTKTVVYTIVALILVDLAFTTAFYALGM